MSVFRLRIEGVTGTTEEKLTEINLTLLRSNVVCIFVMA